MTFLHILSYQKYSGTPLPFVTTKNHWERFHDPLADDGNNHCPNHQENQGGEGENSDSQEPNFTYDIAPAPIHYPSHYHSQVNSSYERVPFSGEREPKQMQMLESCEVRREQLLTTDYESPKPSIVTFV